MEYFRAFNLDSLRTICLWITISEIRIIVSHQCSMPGQCIIGYQTLQSCLCSWYSKAFFCFFLLFVFHLYRSIFKFLITTGFASKCVYYVTLWMRFEPGMRMRVKLWCLSNACHSFLKHLLCMCFHCKRQVSTNCKPKQKFRMQIRSTSTSRQLNCTANFPPFSYFGSTFEPCTDISTWLWFSFWVAIAALLWLNCMLFSSRNTYLCRNLKCKFQSKLK